MSKEVRIGLISAVVIIAGLLGYQYLINRSETQSAVEPERVAEAAEEPRIQYPVPEPKQEPSLPPLPSLNESDAAVHGELATLFAAAPIEAFLIPKRIIQNFVATVNSLDGQIVPMRLWPLAHVPKLPVVTTEAEVMTLSADNAKRYAPYVAALKKLDAQAAAQVYLRYYPLFQQAYIELGFPDRYFNDRLISVISHLLETPEVKGPIKLVRPKVLYEYEDFKLEQLSSGQKLLIRMGPENAAATKAKLREIRDALVQASKPAP